MVRLLSIICLSLSYFVLSLATAFASDCASDPNECTPKDLCEVATEVTDGNKLWSTSATSSKHVSFAKELGMNCGVVELKDPCDTDPNQCKINQLCEKATVEDGGTKSWNNEAEAYVEVAKEYGLDCGVGELSSSTKAVQSTGSEVSCTLKSLQGCSEDYICTRATYFDSRDQNIQWANGLYTDEANRRGLTCGVGETTTCSINKIKNCSDKYICSLATYHNASTKKKGWVFSGVWLVEAKARGLQCGVNGVNPNIVCTYRTLDGCNDIKVCENATNNIGGKGIRWSELNKDRVFVAEAKSRGLTCGVDTQSAQQQCDFSNPKICTDKQVCGYAVVTYGYARQSYKAWSISRHNGFVNEAKARGLSCGDVIEYNLRIYDTRESTNKGHKGDISIYDAFSAKGTDAFYSWASGGYARFWTDYDPDQTYYSDAYTNTVFPKLTSAFKQKTKSDRQRIQRNLKNKGLYDSTIDGLWGRNTLVALTDYSSKRLRTIRLTDPQIVQTLMDQIMSDTSSGDVGLASSEVINEIYAHLENINKLEENSDAFANEFKVQTKLKRQQIQYALRKLGYYNSGIDGLWGNGTKTAITSFAASHSLTTRQPNYVISNLLSRVKVPTNFDPPKKKTTSSTKRQAALGYTPYGATLMPVEQAIDICKPQAEAAFDAALSNLKRNDTYSGSCTSYGRYTDCTVQPDPWASAGRSAGILLGMAIFGSENTPMVTQSKKVMKACMAQYGWKKVD